MGAEPRRRPRSLGQVHCHPPNGDRGAPGGARLTEDVESAAAAVRRGSATDRPPVRGHGARGTSRPSPARAPCCECFATIWIVGASPTPPSLSPGPTSGAKCRVGRQTPAALHKHRARSEGRRLVPPFGDLRASRGRRSPLPPSRASSSDRDPTDVFAGGQELEHQQAVSSIASLAPALAATRIAG